VAYLAEEGLPVDASAAQRVNKTVDQVWSGGGR